MLTGLVSGHQVQADFFDSQNRTRSKQLMSALDTINDRWETGTLHYASSGIRKAWETQFHWQALAYTTDSDALPIVMA